MKTLFLFLLMVPLFASSQYVDKNGKDLLLSGYRTIQDSAVYRPKLDTVKVVMLVSDTTRNTYSEKRYEGLEAGKPHYSYKTVTSQNNDCFWQYGYSVRKHHASGEYIERYTYWTNSGYEHLKYLDFEKKPIIQGLIIWQSVPVKNLH